VDKRTPKPSFNTLVIRIQERWIVIRAWSLWVPRVRLLIHRRPIHCIFSIRRRRRRKLNTTRIPPTHTHCDSPFPK